MSYFSRVQRAISTLQLKQFIRYATVYQIKGDRMRCLLGYDNNGEKVLSPWIEYVTRRGVMTTRHCYSEPPKDSSSSGLGGASNGSSGGAGSGGSSSSEGKVGTENEGSGGQNVVLLCPNGEWDQAMILPGPANKNNLGPSHGTASGFNEESTQFGGDFRTLLSRKEKSNSTGSGTGTGGTGGGGLLGQAIGGTSGASGTSGKQEYKFSHTTWLQKKEESQQQQGNVDTLPEHKDDTDHAKARVSVRMGDGEEEDSKGIAIPTDKQTGATWTAKVGKNRVSVNQKGATIKFGGDSDDVNNIVTVTKDGVTVLSKDKDVFVDAKKNVHIKAAENLHLTAAKEVHINATGSKIIIDSSEVHVKGSTVKIGGLVHIDSMDPKLKRPFKLGSQSPDGATGASGGSDSVPNDDMLGMSWPAA